MNPQILLGWLESQNASIRVRAARHFAKEQHANCLNAIRIAFQKESVPWVKTALAKALAAYQEPVDSPPTNDASRFDGDEVALAESQAISESIGQVLHELEPVIGRLRVVAKESVDDFDTSAMKIEFDNLKGLIATFEDWRKVELSSKPISLNVRTVLEEVALQLETYADPAIAIQILTNEEVVAFVDLVKLKIVISNAIRNAKDAVVTLGESSPITVAFGLTDKVCWISVVDRGVGLPPNQTSIFKSKISTKPGHRGMGLAIVDKAVQAIDGEWDLRNGTPGGAEFYLEIPKA